MGRCPRCDAPLRTPPPGRLDSVLALALTGSVLVVILNVFPLLSLSLHSAQRETTLIGASMEMWHQDMHLLATLVFVTTVFAPVVQIALHVWVLWLLHAGRDWSALRPTLRRLHRLKPWSMGEVFLLGLLVSLVKLQHLADIVLGPAFWACVGLIFITAALNAKVDARSAWAWHERRHERRHE